MVAAVVVVAVAVLVGGSEVHAQPTAPQGAPVFTGRPNQLPPDLQRPRPGPGLGQPPGIPPRDRSGRPTPPPAEGTASIVGRVVDAETGQPLRRASVRAFLTTARTPQESRAHVARTDDQGAYRIDKLPAGTYSLGVQRTGYVMTMPGMGPGTQRISVEDGQRHAADDFRLQRGGVITGRVTDDAGEPAEGVMVRVLRAQRVRGRERYVPAAGRVGSSDDLGNFRVYGLPAGEYIVAAEPTGGMMMPNAVMQGDQTDVVATYAPGTPSPADATTVTVTAGQTSSVDIQLVAARVVTVAGRVVDSTGAPVDTAMVSLQPDGAAVMPMGIRGFGTVNAGAFRIGGVSPGAYVLVVQVRPMGPVADPREMARFESARVPLVVGSEDLENLTVTTAPPSTLAGRVVIEGDATALDLSQLRIFGRAVEPVGPMFGGPGGQGRVDAERTFSIAGLTGVSTLTLGGLPRGWWLKAIRVDGKDALDGFDYGTGRAWTGAEIVLNNRPAAIGGQVVGAGGQPATGANVLVFPVDFAERETLRAPGLVGMGMPDQNGTFAVESLRPGEYYVVVLPTADTQNSPLDDPDRLAQLAERAERVTIAEGDMRFMTLKVEP